MLRPEEARRSLSRFGWQELAFRGAGLALVAPEALRWCGHFFAGTDWLQQGFNDLNVAELRAPWGARRLDFLPHAARTAVLRTLFPLSAPDVSRAWELGRCLPYQVRGDRLAFRAPHQAAVSAAARWNRLHAWESVFSSCDRGVQWLSEWAAHIANGGMLDATGVLFAAVLDGGGARSDRLLDTLQASAAGKHPIGIMGRHVPRALLCSSRPEAWEYVEKLLLAAQREEGLRQVILEAVDEAHPQAFRRMLSLVLERDLLRFSATVRAADVWLGMAWDSSQSRKLRAALETVLPMLDSPAMRDAALRDGDPQQAYLALWATAFEDAPAALASAQQLLGDAALERRYIGAHVLAQLGLPEARRALLKALEDEDLRVVMRAVSCFQEPRRDMVKTDLFERLENAISRLPAKKRDAGALIWPWHEISLDRGPAAVALLAARGKRPAQAMIPHLPLLNVEGRALLLRELLNVWRPDAATRDTLLALAADPSSTVREIALDGLRRCRIRPEDAERLEALLTRKAAELRRGIVLLLASQPRPRAVASADRLLASDAPLQRLAGIELLRRMIQLRRRVSDCRRRAVAQRARGEELTAVELERLDALLGAQRDEPRLSNALGLCEPRKRSRLQLPSGARARLVTPASQRCIRSLEELVHQHRQDHVRLDGDDDGHRMELLGNLRWGLPPAYTRDAAPPLPLQELWDRWERDRPSDLCDPDGLELVRALGWLLGRAHGWGWDWSSERPADKLGERFRRGYYHGLVCGLIQHLALRNAPENTASFALESFASCVRGMFWGMPELSGRDTPGGWLELVRLCRERLSSQWKPEHSVRLFRLLQWASYGSLDYRFQPTLDELAAALTADGATEADLYYHLLGFPESKYARRHGWLPGRGFQDLGLLTSRNPSAAALRHPRLLEAADRCRKRILEIELGRGEAPTAASAPAMALRSSGGIETLLPALETLGPDALVRTWGGDGMSRPTVFSHLVRVSFPGETDSYEAFTAATAAAKLAPRRLLELAVYAPQWAAHVEAALDYPGLTSGVWWLRAHSKDQQWAVETEVREAWRSEVNEFTPLTPEDLLEGAVDVAWFQQAYSRLGAARWKELDAVAKFASSGGGHTRAQLFANAMTGKLDRDTALKRVEEKRHQDTVRALGLIPLAAGEERAVDLRRRYDRYQEFLRGARKFGSQRQASEKLAVRIGLENLARTAGYRDPLRLEWALEAAGVADLADGPLTLEVEDVSLQLGLDHRGQPDLQVRRNGRALKAVPATLKGNADVAALRARVSEIRKQSSRARKSLEAAMCRGDVFTGAELRDLSRHPVLWPMLERLVLVGSDAAGYPAEGGASLRDHTGRAHSLPVDAVLRIAHPHDLFIGGEWSEWQRECFRSERVQPFKQLFRELYLLTDAERDAETLSHRYAGHQVQPRQALALFTSREWLNVPEEGVRRSYHEAGIVARVRFDVHFFTPAEVDGLTVDSVRFTRRGETRAMPLTEVPPRLFSEAMRDLDLVVSVAHRSGVDPEATASTVETRGALVRELAHVLRLGNVSVQARHALIEGHFGEYNVHLGSGVVHRQPGGQLCIIPVQAQHRGRLFLPFADDDPRTAEVLSKVLLLARDQEIKDPGILEQLTYHA
ncbi:MAG: DUF5724 domain-containing protein [Actinomycetota bacterium]